MPYINSFNLFRRLNIVRYNFWIKFNIKTQKKKLIPKCVLVQIIYWQTFYEENPTYHIYFTSLKKMMLFWNLFIKLNWKHDILNLQNFTTRQFENYDYSDQVCEYWYDTSDLQHKISDNRERMKQVLTFSSTSLVLPRAVEMGWVRRVDPIKLSLLRAESQI